MKIGVTERGDAGIDFTWVNKLKNRTVDGAILITKNVNDTFIKNVMDLYKNGFTQIIVHCTCTGHGRTIIEPNVPAVRFKNRPYHTHTGRNKENDRRYRRSLCNRSAA